MFTVQTAQSLLHNAWPPATRWAELCWIRCRKNAATAAALSEGPRKTGSPCCPSPWEEHLITQVTFCMSALNLPLTREPLQTGGIRWDYRPPPLPFVVLMSIPHQHNSPLPTAPTHPPVRPWRRYREAVHWQAETRTPPFSSSLHSHMQTRIYSQKHTDCP